MNEYLKAQNKTNEIIIANNFTGNELDRFSASDFRWDNNRTKQFRYTQDVSRQYLPKKRWMRSTGYRPEFPE